MSLSRLPQVALRRLMPAISAVPKSLDDEQLKKILDPQHPSSILKAMPTKSELASMTTPIIMPKHTSTLGRLLMNLSGAQGVLSTQDLALLKAAPVSAEGSLLATPEPSTPELLAIDCEPAAGALDAASVDALVTALRGTAAISTTEPSAVGGAGAAALEEHHMLALDDYSDQSDDEMPISNDLSAAERRKEQNRRAQKKFRQKDKVRQKEIKWRASQYEDLVESNKRFKKDIDSLSQERDMYRRILEQNGISLDAAKPVAAVAAASRPLNPSSASRSPSVPESTSPALLPLGMEQIAQDTFGASAVAQPAVSMGELFNSLMFGAVKADPMFGGVSTVGLFGPGGAAHRSLSASSGFSAGSNAYAPTTYAQSLLDSMSTPAASEPLYAESSPGMIDHHVVDTPYVGAESQLVDPMAFIDELLAASPGFSAVEAQGFQSPAYSALEPASFSYSPMESPSFAYSPMDSLSLSHTGSSSVSRKRSFDAAMF
ncbi:hypothetical protein GGI24_004109 [Coemansia furcata]|nr:hypothetical protein GGI24_004109 [Coemansia furcata]